ncbi:pre-rRNA-processing protein ESF1 [Ziziphus jujuba]|uniref:Pre-rRNA-processing protein ESF1 n=1 Tax=Ziziphus jujuba TaxID=326968 RepID=A0A6P4ALP2_ZIZJJ|nr:pre-rRNA-processing protein ESF1 [Ziziphus jujuba]
MAKDKKEKKKKNNNNNKPNKESGPSTTALKSSKHEGDGGGNKIITDPRFASVHSDPRFQKVPMHKSKVSIDSRFNRMFTDKSFTTSSAPVDKRGKRKKDNSENSLRHYYRMDEDRGKEESDDEEDSESEESEKLGPEESDAETSDESDASETEEEVEMESGESEYSSATDEDEEEVVYEDYESEEEDIPEIEKETHRLAVLNMDWRYVKAVDLFMILNSFLPKNGQILSVAVYPSEFGLQRMKEEEAHGPALFNDESKKNDNEDTDDDEIDEDKLRAYEKSRLRYYYAVVECDSSATADYLYKACDGVEFERSSNVLDLRFIPDSMEFKHPPRDVATEVPANYSSREFHTRALQHSKIHLSWDEDEPDRAKTLKRKFNADQLADLELQQFLASDESESDDDEDDNGAEDYSDNKHKKLDMYRALIQSGDGSDEDGEEEGQDMEVTFNTDLEDLSKRILEKKDKKEETVWEAYLSKRREKKKARRNKSKYSSDDETSDGDQEATEEVDDFFVEEPSVKRSKKESQLQNDKKGEKQSHGIEGQAEASIHELELLLADDNVADKGLKGYNLKPKKVKGKKGKKVKETMDEDEIPTVDYNDPRFSALFTSPLFALDPTDPQFKRSAAYARQLAMKQQMGEREPTDREHIKVPAKVQAEKDEQVKSDDLPLKKEKYELSSLVKSVKMKSKQVKLLSDGNTIKKGKEKVEKDGLATLVTSAKKKTRGHQK